MNYFATQLDTELSSLPETRKELAEKWELNKSALSQLATGTLTAGSDVLSKILRNVEPAMGARLAAAWLKDKIPTELAPGAVNITTSNGVAETTEDWPETDNELKKHLSYLIIRANRHPEIRKALISLANGLRGN